MNDSLRSTKIKSLLSDVLVKAYTSGLANGGDPSLEDISKFFEKDFAKFAETKMGTPLNSEVFNWSNEAGPAYDEALCTLIENGTLRN